MGLNFSLNHDSQMVLAVALITWGGVWIYLLRLERLARQIEREISRRGADDAGQSV